MTEAFLHYIWQYQMLDGGLTTTDGQPVVVLKAGELNKDAGPDFFNARVRIGQVEWAGNVEVHIRTTDWHCHRHDLDAAYNNVVLHVVYEHDGEIFRQDGQSPATLELKRFLHPALVANYEALTTPPAGNPFPCFSKVAAVPQFLLSSWLERLTVERIEAKAETVHRMLDESKGNWSQTCYWLMARYFGGKVNALAFELLAKSLDHKILARWNNDRVRVEALLMGQAGLLDPYFEDEYPRRLQSDYEPLRTALRLSPIDRHLWKFHRLRPSNFPTIRISQFADLLSSSTNLFSTLLDITDVKELERLFNRSAAPYWDNHYQFDRLAGRSSAKHMGRMQADLLIINAWLPLLFVYGAEHGSQHYKDQALHLLGQLPPEDNAVIRQWQQAGVGVSSAADSQALLQLYNNYCSSRRCLECRVGYHLLKSK